MELVIAPAAELAQRAAREFVSLLQTNPQATIGLATGSSPLGIYDAIVEHYKAGEVSFAQASAVTLDEYVGLEAGHPESYREFIITHLISRIDLPLENLYTPDGQAADPQAAADEYDRGIAARGGVDIQILGIGTNGHIAFNEPGSAFDSRTRVQELAEQTRIDNARFFDGDINQVPTLSITQGIGTIMEARKLVLIASGEAKADAVAQMVEGELTTDCPATIIQRHPNALILIDEAAASKLSR